MRRIICLLAVCAIAFFSATFLVVLETSSGETTDKPTGFSGYLLDTTGLDSKPTEDVWRETFESSGVSWRCVFKEGDIEIERHQRVGTEARDGERSELIQYKVKRPGVIVFGHYVDYPSAFKEADPGVWVRSDRPCVSFAALVVFPKTLRPDTNEPLTAVIPGATYQTPGEWRRLNFPQGLDKAIEEVAQGIRGEHKIGVSCDCAYIRQLLLISEARNGRYEFYTDDVEVVEHIRPSLDMLRESERGARFAPINLLSARLQLSQAPIFWQDSVSEGDDYGYEPFGLDQEKVAKSKKQVLKFLDGVKPRRSDKDVELLANGNGSAKERANRYGGSGRSNVEQAGFSASDGLRERVASVSFDERSEQENSKTDYLLDYQFSNDLISGSGTVSNSSVADSDYASQSSSNNPPKIEISNKSICINGNSYFIRAVEYNYEPLKDLRALGFNAIWLYEQPTSKLAEEAAKENMWLISPIPSLHKEGNTNESGTQQTENTVPPAELAPWGEIGDRVILWNLFSIDETCQQKIQRLDRRYPSRVGIGSFRNGMPDNGFEKNSLIVLLDRAPLQTSLDLNDYGYWLENIQLYLNDAICWNKIQTQPNHLANLQRQFFGVPDDSPGLVSYEQMRQLVRLSIKAGCRGFLFSSNTSLVSKDHKTQYRANALEAINLELMMLTPWIAGGKVEKNLATTDSPYLNGFITNINHSVLVAPISVAPFNQYVMGQDYAEKWSLLINAKDGYEPELLTPGALRKIMSKRIAGGRSFTLTDASMNSLLFLTQSEPHIGKMIAVATPLGKRMATLAISLARKRVDLYQQTVYALNYAQEHGAFPRSAPPVPELGVPVEKALRIIGEAETFLERQDYSQAYLNAEKATREIRGLERDFWEKATKSEIARPVTPLSTSFYDMPAYLELYEKIASKKIQTKGDNLISGGNMESNTTALQKDGWSFLKTNDSEDHLNHPTKGDCIVTNEPLNSGGKALCLKVEPKNDSAMPLIVDIPTIIVEKSFPSQENQDLECGQIVCIQGRILIRNDLTNTVDGLTIYDDQGGEALAVRFKKRTGTAEENAWKSFAFYRLATSKGKMRLRISMSGAGEVWLDDIQAHIVE